MDEIISLKISQLPMDIIEQISSSIMTYATILFYNGNVIGSGTFVECNSHFGILSAHHVIGEGIGLKSFRSNSSKKLGVAIAVKADQNPEEVKGIQHLEFDLQHICPHEIGSPPNCKYNEYGPDLIFLEILDREKLGTIKAYSSFWNISYESNLVNNCYDNLSCIWAVCGLPQDWIELQDSSFGRIIGCQCLIGFGGIEKRFDKDGFDYFDMVVNPNSKNDIPSTFKGMSGGGLWKVLLICTGNLQNVKINDIIFSGVIFYGLEQDHLIIRSHGAKSIYEKFPKILKKSKHRS